MAKAKSLTVRQILEEARKEKANMSKEELEARRRFKAIAFGHIYGMGGLGNFERTPVPTPIDEFLADPEWTDLEFGGY